jgi:hypothetical protein
VIDTSGTRYGIKKTASSLWLFEGWHNLLNSLGLSQFDDFLKLEGDVMDRNRRSVVYRIELGPDNQIFYLKIHRNYTKRNISTLYHKISHNVIELKHMMHYARSGLDMLEPVALGWRPGREDVGFLLIKELSGFVSLQDWLSSEACSDRSERRLASEAIIKMLCKMHETGLAHIDLFAWHIYLKKEKRGYIAHPIDLERSKVKGCWPLSQVQFLFHQATDLAMLHLTVPLDQVRSAERMLFFKKYCKAVNIKLKSRFFLRLVLAIARHRGRKRKFLKFGVAPKLRN